MRPINFLKTSLAAAALVLGTASVARANQIADGTYSIDGICFTFQDDNLVSWNSIDSHGGGALTDANGFLCSTGVLGANAWYFTVNENSIIDKYSGICADGGFGGEGGDHDRLQFSAGQLRNIWPGAGRPDSDRRLTIPRGPSYLKRVITLPARARGFSPARSWTFSQPDCRARKGPVFRELASWIFTCFLRPASGPLGRMRGAAEEDYPTVRTIQ
jgi:hypothetical protein